MLLGVTGVISAAPVSNMEAVDYSNVAELDKSDQHEVEALLDELVLLRLKQSLPSNRINASFSELHAQDQTILNKLKEKGVRPLTEEEINILNKSTAQDSEIQPLASKPPTWGPYANVEMLTYGEKTVTVNGKQYKLWINYAIPKENGGPPLVKHYDSVKMIDKPYETSRFVNKVFNLAVQRVIGEVKYLSWTPYDYFWPEGKDFTSFDTYDLLVSYASKMKYVWVHSPSNDLWQLKGSANSVTTHENHITRGFKGGQLYNIPNLVSETVWSDSYDNIETLAATAGFTITSPVIALKYRKDKDEGGGIALQAFPYYASGPADLY